MFSSDRIIAVDIGASKLVVAEFLAGRKGQPQLLNYGIAPLGMSLDRETESAAYIVSALRDILRERNIRPGPLYMTISGQAVFPRYVKLPPAASEKIEEIVRLEAVQNVPFAIEEVVWDYQLFRSEETGDLSVMLVAVKVENVSRLTDCVEAVRMEPEIVDAAPMALYNAARYSYPDMAGCTLLMDIGARSSNLIFIEEERVFCRSVPVAGNTITQELAKEFELPAEEAEELKKEHAVVALGGTFGETDPVVERVSKIVRNVITRLHAEVNRSINFYRSQQGGGLPSRVLLTGGSAVIPHLDTFFRDKLKVPVGYLNPFERVTVSNRIADEDIARNGRFLGEVVGLALRRNLACPLEINLMPTDLLARKAFRRRVPFFAAAAAAAVLCLLALWGYSQRLRVMRDRELSEVDQRITRLEAVQGVLNKTLTTRKAVQTKTDDLAGLVSERTRWMEILDAIQGCLLDGMWITSLAPVAEGQQIVAIDLGGRGFDDKLRPLDAGDKTPFEVFRGRLRAHPLFGEKTDITRLPAVPAGAYARDVTIRIALKTPMKAP